MTNVQEAQAQPFDLDAAIAAIKAQRDKEAVKAEQDAQEKRQEKFDKELPEFRAELARCLTEQELSNLGISFEYTDNSLSLYCAKALFGAKGLHFYLLYQRPWSESYSYVWRLWANEIVDDSAPDFDSDAETFYDDRDLGKTWDFASLLLNIGHLASNFSQHQKSQQRAKHQKSPKSPEELLIEQAAKIGKQPASDRTLFEHYIGLAMQALIPCTDMFNIAKQSDMQALAETAIDMARTQLMVLADKTPPKN